MVSQGGLLYNSLACHSHIIYMVEKYSVHNLCIKQNTGSLIVLFVFVNAILMNWDSSVSKGTG